MKNTLTTSLVFLTLLLSVLGCSRANPFSSKSDNTSSNKTLTDKALDSTLGDEKIGIPECDEVLEMLAEEASNEDDNFVTKAIKKTFLNRIRDGIKKSLEENKNDKTEVAKTCRQFKAQLVKYKQEEQEKRKK